MVGRDVKLVGESGAPRGERRVLVYNPPVLNPELGIRQSYIKASARLTADLVKARVPTLLFGQSRNGVEVMLKYLRDALIEARIDPDVVHGNDVWVLEFRGELRFAFEPRPRNLVVDQPSPQQLDRHSTVEPQVVGEKHRAHSAFAKNGHEAPRPSHHLSQSNLGPFWRARCQGGSDLFRSGVFPAAQTVGVQTRGHAPTLRTHGSHCPWELARNRRPGAVFPVDSATTTSMPTQTLPLLHDALTDEEQAAFQPEQLDYLLEVMTGPTAGATLTIDEKGLIVGSSSDCDVTLVDSTVSRRHLKLGRTDKGVWANDLNSRNGIFLNGVRVEGLLVRREALITVGKTVLRVAAIERGEVASTTFGSAVGKSPAMHELFTSLRRAAPTSANVLLLGETGTGKDVLARSLHNLSPRRHRPFVVVDCGSLSPTLIESELFGHAKGSFTGANTDRQGAFLSANGGTLFLDEVGELPLDLQPRLLRALENRTVRRLGEDVERPVDVRFVAATNRDLRKRASEGAFREDLYFRLAVVVASVPALRERREDIPLLVSAMLGRLGRPDFNLSPELRARLETHDWPGNVRELRNVVECALHGASPKLEARPLAPKGGLPYKEAKDQLVERFTKEYFTKLFESSGRNVAAMARAAGVARTYAHELVKRYGLK